MLSNSVRFFFLRRFYCFRQLHSHWITVYLIQHCVPLCATGSPTSWEGFISSVYASLIISIKRKSERTLSSRLWMQCLICIPSLLSFRNGWLIKVSSCETKKEEQCHPHSLLSFRHPRPNNKHAQSHRKPVKPNHSFRRTCSTIFASMLLSTSFASMLRLGGGL